MGNNIKIIELSNNIVSIADEELVDNLYDIFDNDIVGVKHMENEKILLVQVKGTDKNVSTLCQILNITSEDSTISYDDMILNDVSMKAILLNVDNRTIDVSFSYKKLNDMHTTGIFVHNDDGTVDLALGDKLFKNIRPISIGEVQSNDIDIEFKSQMAATPALNSFKLKFDK